jgi:hypothetical protein
MQFFIKWSILKKTLLGNYVYHGHMGLVQTKVLEIMELLCYATHFLFYAPRPNY